VKSMKHLIRRARAIKSLGTSVIMGQLKAEGSIGLASQENISS